MWITFHDAAYSYHTYIDIYFSDPPKYTVGYCTKATEFTMPPGVDNVRLWTLIRAGERLLLLCNGELIFDLLIAHHYGPTCATKWEKHYAYIDFGDSDKSASDYYREFKKGKQKSQYMRSS